MKYDGYILYADLDGTIRNSKGEISEKDREKIKYFQENGGRFALATGRGVEHAMKLGLRYNAPLIALNGTYVKDTEEDCELAVFSADSRAKDIFISACKEYPNLLEAIIFHKDSDVCISNYGMSYDEIFSETVFKIVYVFGTEPEAVKFLNDMTERYSDKYIFERSWDVGVEILSADGGKGNGVEFVRRYYADKVCKIVCAGNYENDISMLLAADVGVAVENSTEQVKDAADAIAPDCDSDAIAWIIDNIEVL